MDGVKQVAPIPKSLYIKLSPGLNRYIVPKCTKPYKCACKGFLRDENQPYPSVNPTLRIGDNKLTRTTGHPLGYSMYAITVRYCKEGFIAMNLKADTIAIAREKALHFKAQAFHVQINDADGQAFPLED